MTMLATSCRNEGHLLDIHFTEREEMQNFVIRWFTPYTEYPLRLSTHYDLTHRLYFLRIKGEVAHISALWAKFRMLGVIE